MKSLFSSGARNANQQPGPSSFRSDQPDQRISSGKMDLLTIPESPTSRRRELSEVFDDFRRKSISELSLVMDALRGSPSPGSSQYIHPERASQSTGNLNPPQSKKGRRRRKVQKTWQAMSPGNFAKQLQLGKISIVSLPLQVSINLIKVLTCSTLWPAALPNLTAAH